MKNSIRGCLPNASVLSPKSLWHQRMRESWLGRITKRCKINNMKKITTFIILLCVVIIRFEILNNISYNKEMQSKKTTDLSKDSLLYRQVEI